MRRYELTINSRPDGNGIVWAMVQNGSGDHFAGHIAQYLRVSKGADVRFEAGIFVGVKTADITPVIRSVSEYFCGNGRCARFEHADHGASIDGGPTSDHATVGPVLRFGLYQPDAE